VLEHRSLDPKGAALALLLSALWGANPVAIKLGLSDIAPLQMALLRFAVSAVAISAYALAGGRPDVLVIRLAMESGRPTRWTTTLILSIFFQGVIIGGFNFVMNAELLKIYRPSALATVAVTTPIWGVLIAAAIGGESLAPELVLSALLMVIGIALTMRR